MTTTDGAPEVWRVECEDGEVREVEAWRQTWGSGMWCAFLPGSGNGTAPLPSPRAAVAQMAGRQGWPVVAVLAPEQLTRAEVEAERDALRSLLAAAARGELPRCDECPHAATLYAATTAGEFHRCDAHAGGDEWETLPHTAALRAAMGGAK